MKKLFISCPMKGRTDENIKKSMEAMHKIAEATIGEELEVIPSFIEDDPPENVNQAIYYLGRSIQMLSEADYFIGVDDYYNYAGCEIEFNTARSYGIGFILVPTMFVARDILEAVNGKGCCSPVLKG